MSDLYPIMEAASEALARMDYLTCEAHCVEAIALARRQRQWDAIARILLPLQEARRQRRMVAADGLIRLGTQSLEGDAAACLPNLANAGGGCVVVTHPHDADAAARLALRARHERRFVEILFADNSPDDSAWHIRSFAGPAVAITMPAPPAAWRDRDLPPAEAKTLRDGATTPGDWFLDAMDALGDAAIGAAGRDDTESPEADFDRLYACLEVVTDHEILHQRLAEQARRAAHENQ